MCEKVREFFKIARQNEHTIYYSEPSLFNPVPYFRNGNYIPWFKRNETVHDFQCIVNEKGKQVLTFVQSHPIDGDSKLNITFTLKEDSGGCFSVFLS